MKVKMVGRKAIFEIDVSNKGKGRVLQTGTSFNRCPGNLRYDDFDVVDFVFETPGTGLTVEKCTPKENKVRLVNGKGKVFCTVQIPQGPAFETPILMTLRHNYMDSVSAPIEFVRTPE